MGAEAALSASVIGTPIDIALYAGPGQLVASGKGYVDVRTSGAVADAVRCYGTITGTGKWVWA